MGLEHALAVTSSGGCFAWGRGDRGQLGVGDAIHYTAPVRVMEGEGGVDWLGMRIVAVEAGMACSAAIDECGRVWVWGKMQGVEEGVQRGEGFLKKDARVPRRVMFEGEWEGGEVGTLEEELSTPRPRADTPPRPITLGGEGGGARGNSRTVVVALSSGQGHLSLLTSDGKLWMMGLRGRGELFDDSSSSEMDGGEEGGGGLIQLPPLLETFMQTTPWEVPLGCLKGHTVVGIRSSLHHSYALTTEGRLFRWGWKGIVEPFNPRKGGLSDPLGGVKEGGEVGGNDTRFKDVAFGYAHGVGITLE